AHPGLAGDAGGDDDELATGAGRVVVRAQHARVEPLDWSRLPLVERLSLREALDHVHHDDRARQLLLGEPLRRGRAHVARADHRDLVQHERVNLPEYASPGPDRRGGRTTDTPRRPPPA